MDLLIKNISKKIDFNRKYIKFDRIYIEIEILDSNSSLESESDGNRRSNSDRDFDSTMMIGFGTPNRISLIWTVGSFAPLKSEQDWLLSFIRL